MNKNSNKSIGYTKKTFTELYKNMVELKRDLYYKDIVNSNADVIERGTNHLIADIMWRFKKHQLSKFEMFTELESLRSGYKVTDRIVKDALALARTTYCKTKKTK